MWNFDAVSIGKELFYRIACWEARRQNDNRRLIKDEMIINLKISRDAWELFTRETFASENRCVKDCFIDCNFFPEKDYIPFELVLIISRYISVLGSKLKVKNH